MTCGNCGATLTCGCQKRIAQNGKHCCTTCIARCNQEAGGPAVPVPQQPPGRVAYPPGPVRTTWRNGNK